MPNTEHDPELLQRLALVYQGNGEAHHKLATEQREVGDRIPPSWTQHEMLAASSFAIAASLWSLIAPRDAVRSYRAAARMFRGMRHGYWIVLALASGTEKEINAIPSDIDGMLESGVKRPAGETTAQAAAFAMVGNEMSDDHLRGTRAERLNALWRHAGNVPVGRLGIPMDYYGRCAQAMHEARSEKNIDRFRRDAATYVRRAAEVTRSASHDRFHWMRLQSAILPAEPEAVAMTTAMSVEAPIIRRSHF